VITYEVTCQNDAGRRVTVKVTASTDEQACAAALKTLNTWLAVSALPATVELPKPQKAAPAPPAPPVAAVEEEPVLQIGQIVHKSTVVDWIELHIDPRNGRSAVAEAFLAARERIAA
jgi:hypothetical protein